MGARDSLLEEDQAGFGKKAATTYDGVLRTGMANGLVGLKSSDLRLQFQIGASVDGTSWEGEQAENRTHYVIINYAPPVSCQLAFLYGDSAGATRDQFVGASNFPLPLRRVRPLRRQSEI
jgi:hypothetical protein